jgi:hypothetical protein
MRWQMLYKSVFGVVFIVAALLVPRAYAGSMDLTTYYPAPYGEYETLSSKQNTSLATTSGSVTVGSATNPGTVNFTPATAAPAATDGVEGSIRYVKDTINNIHEFYYKNNSAWVPVGGGGGITATTLYGTSTCTLTAWMSNNGYTVARVYAGFVTFWQEASAAFEGMAGAGGFCSDQDMGDTGAAWGANGWWGQSERHRVNSEATRIPCCVCIYSKS